MPPLDRAIALPQVNDRSVRVGEDLHFDVPCPRDVLLQKHGTVTEGPLSLRAGLFQPLGKLLRAMHDTHSAPATAKGGLHDERISNCFCRPLCLLRVVRRQTGAGNDRHARLLRDLARLGLVPQPVQQFRRRSYERDARLSAGPGEVAVLGEETVPRMNRVNAASLCQGDDSLDVEIGCDRTLVATYLIGFVRLEAVQAETILVGIDGGGAQSEFGRRAHDAGRDLAAVGR